MLPCPGSRRRSHREWQAHAESVFLCCGYLVRNFHHHHADGTLLIVHQRQAKIEETAFFLVRIDLGLAGGDDDKIVRGGELADLRNDGVGDDCAFGAACMPIFFS